MSNAGQAVLTVVGAVVGGVVGFYAGGPAGAFSGAMRGAALGYAVGTVVSPTELPTIYGPRLDDLTTQTSQYGVDIPYIYGSTRVAGNLIWSDVIKETSHTTEQGGKGGGPTQETVSYTYSRSFAVGLCEGKIGTIKRIWANGTVIYHTDTADNSDISASISATVYTGSESQKPSSVIEAVEGAGEVPAYKGTAYVVFEDFQLADYGRRIPNLEFEVIAAPVNYLYQEDIKRSQIMAWTGTNTQAGEGVWKEIYVTDLDGNISVHFANAVNGVPCAAYFFDNKLNLLAWADLDVSPSGGTQSCSGIARQGDGKYVVANQSSHSDPGTYHRKWYVVGQGNKIECYTGAGAGLGHAYGVGNLMTLPDGTLINWYNNTLRIISVGYPSSELGILSGKTYEVIATQTVAYTFAGNPFYWWYRGSYDMVMGERSAGGTWICLNARSAWQLYKWDGGVLTYCGGIGWPYDGGSNGQQWFSPSFNGDYVVGRSGKNNSWSLTICKATDTGWETIYLRSLDIGVVRWFSDTVFGVANDNGLIICEWDADAETYEVIQNDGYVYPTTIKLGFPVHGTNYFCELKSDGTDYWIEFETVIDFASQKSLSLAVIVTDICINAGLLASDIDVTGLLPYDVNGYVIANNTSPRAMLEPLMVAYQFDAVEQDNKIVFVKRGVVFESHTLTWANVIMLTITDNVSVYKSTPSNSWNGTANSVEGLSDSGYLVLTVTSVARIIIGLSDSPSGSGYSNIDYAIYYHTDGDVRIREFNSNLAGQVYPYEIGDVWMIQKDGDTIKYWQNGAIVYTSLVASSGDQYCDMCVYDYKAKIDVNGFFPSFPTELSEDDLSAHEDGSSDLVPFPTNIEQEIDLPLAVAIKYSDNTTDYQVNEQEVTRVKY